MFSCPARWALADIATLWQYVAGCTMLTGFPHTGIQRCLAILPRVLRWTDTLVIRWFVFRKCIIIVLVSSFVIKIVVIIAIRTGALISWWFSYVLSLRTLLLLVNCSAMRTFTPNDIQSAVFIIVLFLSFWSLLRSASALSTVAQIFLEYWLTGCPVLAGQTGASIVEAFLYPVSLQYIFVFADVKIHRYSIDLQFANATEKSLTRSNVIVHSATKRDYVVTLIVKCSLISYDQFLC